MNKETWIQFSGFRQLAKWLVDTSKGVRFLEWFGKNYFAKIMATSAGMELQNRVRKEVEKDMEKRPIVIIETHPDGFIRVYSDVVRSVTFVNRIETFQKCEALDEERCWLSVSISQRDIYLNDRCLIGCENVQLHPRTLPELLETIARKETHCAVDYAKLQRG